jgi:hypothetical protein
LLRLTLRLEAEPMYAQGVHKNHVWWLRCAMASSGALGDMVDTLVTQKKAVMEAKRDMEVQGRKQRVDNQREYWKAEARRNRPGR